MARVAFTAGRVNGFRCPPDKKQAFLWDATTPGLGLRVTPAGKPAFIFQGVFGGGDIRITIGSPAAWSIPQAQAKARELQRQIDEGQDPREVKRQRVAEQEAKRQQEQAEAVTVGEAWAIYLEERRPHWGERHYIDHINLSKAGGEAMKNRRQGKTKPGPLHHFMPMALKSMSAEAVEQWAQQEGRDRPTVARLAWRCLKAFLNWCAEHRDYANALTASNPAKTKKAREALGKVRVKSDALMREQLPAWFDAVGKLANPTVSAYFFTLLLTGARSGEVITLKWEDINWQWRGMTIRVTDRPKGATECSP